MKVPSAVAYLVLLLFLLGLYRFTAVGLDHTPALRGCEGSSCAGRRPIELAPAPRSSVHLLAPVRLEGHTLLFLVDTGAATSVLDLAVAAELALDREARPILGAVNESFQIQQALAIESFVVGESNYEDFDMAIIDLGSIRAGLGSRVSGVLGANVLGHQAFEIDFEGRLLWLGRSAEDFARARQPDQHDTSMEMKEISGGYFINGVVGERQGLFLVDSGAGGSQVGQALAFHVDRKSYEDAQSFDATGVRDVVVQTAHLSSLVVGAFVRRGFDVDVGESSAIGADFLRGLHLRIDPAEAALTLRYRGEAAVH